MSTDEEVTNSDTEHSNEPIQWDDLSPDKQHELVALADTLGTQDTTEVVDEEGETWTVGALADLGMTRRQALLAFACLAAGYTLRDAVVRAVIGEARAGTQSAGQIGTVANPADFVSEDNTIVSQSGSPGAPSNAGDIVFFNDSGTLKQKDSSGTVSEFGGLSDVNSRALAADYRMWTDGSTVFVADYSGVQYSDANAAVVLDDLFAADNDAHVLVGPGDYSLDVSALSQTWVRCQSGTLEGIGADKVTFTVAASTNPFAALRFNANGGGARRITVDGNKANNTSGHGIYANNRTNVTVQECVVQNCPDSGVGLLNACADCTVEDVTVTACDDIGIHAVGDNHTIESCDVDGSGAGTNSANIQLRNGEGGGVYSCTVTNGNGHGVVLNNGHTDGTVADVDARNNTTTGVVVSENCRNCTVEGGAASYNGELGVTIDTNSSGTPQAGECVVDGIETRGNATHGVNVQNSRDTVVSGVVSVNNTNAGVRITGTSSTGCSVTGVRCLGNADGLVIDADDCAVAGAVLLGNTTNFTDNGANTATAAVQQ